MENVLVFISITSTALFVQFLVFYILVERELSIRIEKLVSYKILLQQATRILESVYSPYVDDIEIDLFTMTKALKNEAMEVMAQIRRELCVNQSL